jgi:hypothetical protein
LDCFKRCKFILLGLKELFPSVAFPPLGIVISYLLVIPIYENLGLVPRSGLVEAFYSLVGPGVCFSLAEMCFSRLNDIRQSAPWRNETNVPLQESMKLGAFLAMGVMFNCIGGLYTLTLTLKGDDLDAQSATEPTALAWAMVVVTSLLCLIATAFFLGASTKILESFEFGNEPTVQDGTVGGDEGIGR